MFDLFFLLSLVVACGPCFCGETGGNSTAKNLKASAHAEAEPRPSVCGGMVAVPEGEFFMGTPGGRGGSDERPRHKVRLNAYFIDRCEATVTQYMEYSAATGKNMPRQPSWSVNDHPVVAVDWFEAQAYCEWRGKRLPTEAEWEKAARGGTDSEYSFGGDQSKLGEYAWYNVNSGGQSRPVGQKKPNLYGLYDIHGNAGEWVSDWYDAGYYAKSPEENPRGPDTGTVRVMRGGSWYYYGHYFALNLRVADRYWDYPQRRSRGTGFRCAKGRAGDVFD